MVCRQSVVEVLVALATLIGVLIALGAPRRLVDSEVSDPPRRELKESVDYDEYEGDRSSKWPKVRDQFVAVHPQCEACGSVSDLNVHHVKPFASHPELELDTNNLITLCRVHHFRVGHDPDGPWNPQQPSWSKANPRVREDCKAIKAGKFSP
jgi:5-methylcytosine-specific restriction endonuclease McrA